MPIEDSLFPSYDYCRDYIGAFEIFRDLDDDLLLKRYFTTYLEHAAALELNEDHPLYDMINPEFIKKSIKSDLGDLLEGIVERGFEIFLDLSLLNQKLIDDLIKDPISSDLYLRIYENTLATYMSELEQEDTKLMDILIDFGTYINKSIDLKNV